MFRKLLYLLNLVKPSQIDTKKINNKDITSKNPYKLVWYRSDWSERMIQKNNRKYWEWEIKNNEFTCP